MVLNLLKHRSGCLSIGGGRLPLCKIGLDRSEPKHNVGFPLTISRGPSGSKRGIRPDRAVLNPRPPFEKVIHRPPEFENSACVRELLQEAERAANQGEIRFNSG